MRGIRTSISVAYRLFLGSLALFLLSLAAYVPGTLAAAGPYTVEFGPTVEMAALCDHFDSSDSDEIETSESLTDDGLRGCPQDDVEDSDPMGEGSPNNTGELLEDEVDRDELLLIDDWLTPLLTVDERISSRTGPSPVDGSASCLEKPPRL